MNLRYITCSDPREFNDIHDIVKLGQMSSRVEIAVQAHPSKMSPGMPRNEWFHDLLDYVMMDKYKIRLALHVNREWCDAICRTGQIPKELTEFFDLHRNGNIYNSVVKRWQLNIPAETVPYVNIPALSRFIDENPEKYFILQYNPRTEKVVNELYKSGARFSVLYDASGGRGISPDAWRAPVFPILSQGYSGGMSPENVSENLGKISNVVTDNRSVWIDAEGKLKVDDKFNIVRARQYIENAENWITQNNKQR
ncbi:MAG: hypothetical protein IJ866_03915 [Alphaproteobacteria bacterium]|nr:hypothetical protein [Alphaproteobacteria bacterium]